MRRFYIEKISNEQDHCIISGPEARHITKVLRMKPGDHLILMDAQGARFKACIESVTSRSVLTALQERLPPPPASPVTITLCQALPKSHAMDYLIQKTSELGVDHIIPFISERTVARFEPSKYENKMRHWHEIAINAAKQSGRAMPVSIEMPCTADTLSTKFSPPHALKVILWEDESVGALKQVLRACGPADNFVGIVGPEGGFTQTEITSFKKAGFVSVSLGNRILRSETAAVTLTAIVQYEMGDLGCKVEGGRLKVGKVSSQ